MPHCIMLLLQLHLNMILMNFFDSVCTNKHHDTYLDMRSVALRGVNLQSVLHTVKKCARGLLTDRGKIDVDNAIDEQL